MEAVDPPTTTTAPSTATTAPPTTTTAPGLPPFSQDSINPGQQEAYSFVSSSGVEIEYLLYVPNDYEDRAWPLILSLHGFLGRGDQTLELVRPWTPVAWVDPSVEFPFVVVAPLGPSGLWSQYHEPMDELFDVLGEALSINQEARFLTGWSAGAIGTWQWALARPDKFAGIAPIAGGLPGVEGVVPEDICRLVDLPIWVAHSEADEEAPIDSDAAIVAELEECGSTVVRFTVYEDLGHVESISTAYAGPDLYEWMLEQVP